MIDLRSDTVTKPTPAMRQAMATAEVGDDVLGEDPTVNHLQHRMASLLGKEAALFVPSGTMANQVAIKTHIQPGDEIIIDQESHIFYYECAATAVISGGQFRCLLGERGILSTEAIAKVIRPPDVHQPPSRLICLENTHTRGGGSIYSMESLVVVIGYHVKSPMWVLVEFIIAPPADIAIIVNEHILERDEPECPVNIK